MKTYTLGIDPGFARAPTGCAMLEFDGGVPRLMFTHSISHHTSGDWQKRVSRILGQMEYWLRIEVLPYYPKFLFAYELAHVDRNIQTALRLADLGGGIRGLATAMSYPCIGVSSLQSKQALTGDERATKEQMQRMAFVLFDKQISDHEADAAGHALAGEALVRLRAIEALL